MTAPEKMTPNVYRDAMTEDPKLDAVVVLMLTRIMPALHHAKEYGSKAYPDDAEFIHWTNGSIFGAVAAYITLNHEEAGLEEITKVYGCISSIISDTLDRYDGFDLEQYAQDFLVQVGAEKEASS
ncbi:MAG: hypothetical protein IIC36_14970 [Gemmatimonadetes bacterium]|nr:hypothetical protein [Gemmatimonadota bacterium]